jgi:succinate dehydrogenase hydrophobic anchor subunit
MFPVLYMLVFGFLYNNVCTFDVETYSSSYNISIPGNAAKTRRMMHCEQNITMVIFTLIIYIYIFVHVYCDMWASSKSDSYKIRWRSWLNWLALIIMGVAVFPGIYSSGWHDMSSQYAIASVSQKLYY